MSRLPILCILMSSFFAGNVLADFPFFQPINPPRPVQVMAHRGLAKQAPENTSAAIEQAIADGVEWVEIDVRLTKDGHHVLLHDATLDRTTNGKGLVAETTLAEIEKLDAGSWFARRFGGQTVLTLKQALALAKGKINLYLDCKQIDPALLAKGIVEAGVERQVVVFDSLETLQKIRNESSGSSLALMPKWRNENAEAIEKLSPAAIEFNVADVTPERCKFWHAKGVKVQAKVLDADDRPEVWDRMIAAGVDWLQTDRAEEILARQALKAIGKKPAKIAFHRGAGRYAPENTLPALEKAIILGADFVEFDVRTAKDGGLFLLHDGTLNRTTALKGPMRDRTTSELTGLDAGSWFGRPFVGTPMPTADAFMTKATGHVELYVDAKDIAPDVLVQLLRKYDMIDRSVVYGGVDFLERLKKVEPRLRRMPPLGDPKRIDEIVARVEPYAFDTKWSILTKPLIDRCHAANVKVFSDALGANESIAAYQTALKNGIDLIQTDHPLRVLRAMELLGNK